MKLVQWTLKHEMNITEIGLQEVRGQGLCKFEDITTSRQLECSIDDYLVSTDHSNNRTNLEFYSLHIYTTNCAPHPQCSFVQLVLQRNCICPRPLGRSSITILYVASCHRMLQFQCKTFWKRNHGLTANFARSQPISFRVLSGWCANAGRGLDMCTPRFVDDGCRQQVQLVQKQGSSQCLWDLLQRNVQGIHLNSSTFHGVDNLTSILGLSMNYIYTSGWVYHRYLHVPQYQRQLPH